MAQGTKGPEATESVETNAIQRKWLGSVEQARAEKQNTPTSGSASASASVLLNEKQIPRPLSFSNGFIEISLTYHIIHPFKVYNSKAFSTYTELCSHHHNQF